MRVGSEVSDLNLVGSLMILKCPFSYSALSKITTPLPLFGCKIEMFLFFHSPFKMLCFFKSVASMSLIQTFKYIILSRDSTNLLTSRAI